MIVDRRKTLRGEKEAAAWFTLLNDASAEVENEALEKFDEWIQRDGNRAAYRRIEDISSTAIGLRNDPELQAATREALARPKASRLASSRLSLRAPRLWGGIALAGVVAAALVVLVGGQSKTYQTEVGGRVTAHLDDGSTVQLNTDTRLKVRFTHGARRLELVKGQAFFDVAHDVKRPFLVTAGPMEVRAVGTRFDVRHDGPGASVILAQGQVRVIGGARASVWTLSPGQGLTLQPGGNARPERVDVASLTGWTNNVITFQDVDLIDAVAEMNRYARAKITLAPGVPSRAKMSGLFSPGEQREFVDAAAASFNLEAIHKPDGGVELRPRSGA
ncbi:FecR family protein [soil metagenome]